MARKTATVRISKEGRDFGKTFHIQELPAMQIEQWAIRAFIALAKSGVSIPEDAASLGIAGVIALGVDAFAGIDYRDAEPLLAEMLTCVSVIPDPSKPNVMRSDIETDIEEVSTLLFLRKEAFNLMSGFTKPVVDSTSNPTTMGQRMPNTRTSRAR